MNETEIKVSDRERERETDRGRERWTDRRTDRATVVLVYSNTSMGLLQACRLRYDANTPLPSLHWLMHLMSPNG